MLNDLTRIGQAITQRVLHRGDGERRRPSAEQREMTEGVSHVALIDNRATIRHCNPAGPDQPEVLESWAIRDDDGGAGWKELDFDCACERVEILRIERVERRLGPQEVDELLHGASVPRAHLKR